MTKLIDEAVLPHDSIRGPCPSCGKKPEHDRIGHTHNVMHDGSVRGGVEVLHVECRAYHRCDYTWYAHTFRRRRSWWARLWSWGY